MVSPDEGTPIDSADPGQFAVLSADLADLKEIERRRLALAKGLSAVFPIPLTFALVLGGWGWLVPAIAATLFTARAWRHHALASADTTRVRLALEQIDGTIASRAQKALGTSRTDASDS